MKQDPKKSTRKHGTHLRVPVLPEEEEAIKKNAAAAGMTVAAFLRSAGIGYQIKGILDNKEVEKLAKINGDLGRLGGLLKLWLTNDFRTAQFGRSTILAVLAKIDATQTEMIKIMKLVVRPKAEK